LWKILSKIKMASAYVKDLPEDEITAEDLENFYNSIDPGNSIADDSDSDDLEYQLQLYAQGDIKTLSEIQRNETLKPIAKPAQTTAAKPVQTTAAKPTHTVPKPSPPTAAKPTQAVPKPEPSTPKHAQKPKDPFIGSIPIKGEITNKKTTKKEPEVDVTDRVPDEVRYKMQHDMNTWLELDDEIKEVNKVVKSLKEQQKKITQGLLQEMKTHQVGILPDNNGDRALKYNITFPKKGYKKSFIQDKLSEFFKDPNLAEQLSEFLETSRPRDEKVSLKLGKVSKAAKSK